MKHIVVEGRSIGTTTGRYAEKLIHHLEDLDHSHRYTILMRPEAAERWRPRNPLFTVAVTDVPFYSLAEQLRLRREILALRPDLVHFTMPQQPLLLGVPRITSFHDLTLLKVLSHKTTFPVALLKRCVGHGAFVIAAHRSHVNIVPSRYTAEDLRRYTRVGPSRIALTYEAADPIEAVTRRMSVRFPRFVLHVGNQTPYKNLRRLIEAVVRVRSSHPDVGLVLAGKIGPDGEKLLGSLSDEESLAVQPVGFVEEAGLLWLYANAQMYAFPSLYEGFGLPGLEAMRHCTPVVSSNSTCLPEIYGDAAQYFDPRDVEDIARTISRVLTDGGLRVGMVVRGAAQARTYSWERMARQTLGLYRDALGEPADPSLGPPLADTAGAAARYSNVSW